MNIVCGDLRLIGNRQEGSSAHAADRPADADTSHRSPSMLTSSHPGLRHPPSPGRFNPASMR